MQIERHIDIAAPADRVWEVLGQGFADVGVWASAIPSSVASPDGGGRVCSVAGAPGIHRVEERLTAYDDATRTLTYVADSGMPGAIGAASNTWWVEPLGPGTSRVTTAASVEVVGLARSATPLLRLAFGVLGRRTLGDLKHHVERGVPSPRKQRALAVDAGGGGVVTGTTPFAATVRRDLAAPAEEVWRAVSDAGDFARFAAGLASTEIVSGAGSGMVRVCTDDHGAQWAERCTLWDEGSRYAMTVDVASYPLRYRVLLQALTQTWSVEPTAAVTRLTLTFDGEVKLGIIGRLAARMLSRPARLEAILDAYERELTTPVPLG